MAATSTECDEALVTPSPIANLTQIADAILQSSQLSAQLLAPLPLPLSSRQPQPPTAGQPTPLSTAASPLLRGFDLFEVPFDSGYNWLEISLTAFLIVTIMIVIIFGNILVIVAVQKDKNLQGIQNYFIVSLAVADLLVGLTIMPLSLVVELMGKWVFGQIACNLWLGGDVLLCTASILNLCMISIDRYWSVTLAGQYTARTRKNRVTVMIVLVWILSTVISLPPLVGWARKASDEDECLLMDDPMYIVYSTFGSFYFPLVVMIVVYIRIFVIARRTARKSAFKLTKQLQKRRTKSKESQQINTSLVAYGKEKEQEPEPEPEPDQNQLQAEFAKNAMSHRKSSTSLLRLKKAWNSMGMSPEKRSESDYAVSSGNGAEAQTLLSSKTQPHVMGNDGALHDASTVLSNVAMSIAVVPRESCASTNLASTSIMVQNTILKAAGSPCTVTQKPLASAQSGARLSDPTETTAPKGASSLKRGSSSKKVSRTASKTTGPAPQPPQISLAEEVERRKKRLAKERERRTTRILVIIMLSFIGCWFPFFTLYLVSSLAGFNVNKYIFATFFWLGYFNSALNPVSYAAFNQDFRAAFKRLLKIN